MKKLALYILALAVVSMPSCISMDDDLVPDRQNGKKLEIMASVADYSSINVGTKALEDKESEVKELTMFVFDSDGVIVGKPINMGGKNSVFIIDTDSMVMIDGENNSISMTNNQDKLQNCSIYMVANCWHVIENENIQSLLDLVAVDIPVSGIEIPGEGMPMMGFESGFDLRQDRPDGAETLADIEMDKLFAKINVRFQINADQVLHTPSFTLTNWTVSNVPTNVRLGEPAEGAETPHASGTMLSVDGKTTLSDGNLTINHSESVTNPDYFQFTFYVPEHRVNPDPTVMDAFKEQLRTGGGNASNAVPESDWQKYKPKFCASTQKPMYVTVTGAYTDHQGMVSEVIYSLYLGQNNTDDFYINRNQQLNNIITIKGLTNNKAAADNVDNPYNVSVDHRVDVGETGFSISMERETHLDSHYEVRPMDVIVSAGGKVRITVNSDDDPRTDDDWLRIEKSGSSNAHISGVGVRKYFTTNLVTETLKDSRVIEINSGDNPRIWLYFDENPNVYDKTITDSPQHRDISINVDYFDAGNDTDTPTSRNVFTFRQMNLWRVWSYKKDASNQDVKDRFYDIEYHEEYLYNYASYDNYGKRKDGMVWGLDGVEFSGNMGADMRTEAVVLNTSDSDWDGVLQYVIRNESPYYDFYLPREAAEISAELLTKVPNNQYAGRRFTNAIIDADVDGTGSYSAIGLIQRELDEDPVSAIEYCLNKNRRNATNGLVDSDSRGWYLPAIDEIEEIMVGGYTDFEVFQNKMYWSCQTAFYRNYLHYDTISGSTDYGGPYFKENTQYARATNALYVGVDDNGHDKYTYAESAITNDGYHQFLSVSSLGSILGFTGSPININNPYPFDFRVGGSWYNGRYESRTLNPAQYDTGYDSRGSQINRVRCVRNSGYASEAQ